MRSHTRAFELQYEDEKSYPPRAPLTEARSAGSRATTRAGDCSRTARCDASLRRPRAAARAARRTAAQSLRSATSPQSPVSRTRRARRSVRLALCVRGFVVRTYTQTRDERATAESVPRRAQPAQHNAYHVATVCLSRRRAAGFFRDGGRGADGAAAVVDGRVERARGRRGARRPRGRARQAAAVPLRPTRRDNSPRGGRAFCWGVDDVAVTIPRSSASVGIVLGGVGIT